MVFSPYSARKLAETTARKVKDAVATDEVLRQIPNQSKSHRAPRDVPHSKSKVKVGRLSDESHRLRDENKTTNWRTGEADKLLDLHLYDRAFGANPSEGRRVTDKIKNKALKKKKRLERDRWEGKDIFQMPLSKVTKIDNERGGMESMFEKMQRSTELNQSLNMGTTKSDKTTLSRDPLKAMGESSYDGTVAKKWTGLGLGLGGAGAGGFAYNDVKEKKTMGRPDYSNYFG